jgi:hypothetical protein
MRVFCVLCGLFLAIALVNGGPVVKRETKEDLNPLNEVSTLFYLLLKKKERKKRQENHLQPRH